MEFSNSIETQESLEAKMRYYNWLFMSDDDRAEQQSRDYEQRIEDAIEFVLGRKPLVI